jgi:signal transduction histidine kinase
MKGLSANRRLALALGISTILVLSNGFIAYRSLEAVRRSDAGIQGSLEATVDAERLLAALADAETGQRGYLLTGDENYLQPYLDATSHVESDFEALSRSVANPKVTQPLRQHIEAKLAELRKTIELRRTRGEAAAVSVVKMGIGRIEMDAIRDLISSIEAGEQHTLNVRSQVAQRNIRVATLMLVLANGFILVLFTALMWILARQTRELEVSVAARTRSLTEANADLETFTYSVSHDLRAPLRLIRGFAHALLHEHSEQLDDTARESLQYLVAAGERMSNLIQDLLTYTRISRAQITPSHVDISRAVEEALRQAEEKPQKSAIKVDIPATVPLVLGHETSLIQVITNLLTNAQKFVKPEQETRITITARAHDGRVNLAVSDNGIGIAPEYQEKIFGVFERLNAQDDYPGTGLGLAIVKRAMERMQGSVGVHSVPGQGSTFWIELPSVKEKEEKDSTR